MRKAHFDVYYLPETILVSMVELSDEDEAGETKTACPIADILMQCTILHERVDRAYGQPKFPEEKAM